MTSLRAKNPLLSVALVFAALGCGDATRDTSPRSRVQGDASANVDTDGDGIPDSPDDGTPDGNGNDAGVIGDSATPDATPPVATVPVAYVGDNGGISRFRVDNATGKLTLVDRLTTGVGNASFLNADKKGSLLYAIDENGSTVAAYAIAPSTGALALVNRVPSEGSGPVYVLLDGPRTHALVSHYGGGTVSVFAIDANGKLGASTAKATTGTNAHSIRIDPSGKFVYVPNKGSNTVSQFVYNAAAGTLTASNPATVATKAGAGPRHMDFHPNGKYAFLINEVDDTLSSYTINTTTGALTLIETEKTLPAGVNGDANTCADIHVSADGKFVYGSNRGNDSIVVFSIDAATGQLTLVGHTSTGGATPRNFTIDPTGNFLYAANQASNNVVAFRIDKAAGTLTKLDTTPIGGSPAWVGIVNIPK